MNLFPQVPLSLITESQTYDHITLPQYLHWSFCPRTSGTAFREHGFRILFDSNFVPSKSQPLSYWSQCCGSAFLAIWVSSQLGWEFCTLAGREVAPSCGEVSRGSRQLHLSLGASRSCSGLKSQVGRSKLTVSEPAQVAVAVVAVCESWC